MNNMFEMAQGGLLQTGRRCYSIRRPVADSVIFVKTLRGDTFAVRHDNAMTITQFQLALSYNSGIDFSNARVIFAGKQLEPGRTMSDYNIQVGSTLHIVPRGMETYLQLPQVDVTIPVDAINCFPDRPWARFNLECDTQVTAIDAKVMLTSLGELPDDVVLEKPSDEVARAPKDEDDAALLPPYVAEGPSTDVLARQLHLFVPRPRSVLETELTRISASMSRGGDGEDGEDVVELFQPLSLQIQCGQVIVDSPDLRRLAISPDESPLNHQLREFLLYSDWGPHRACALWHVVAYARTCYEHSPVVREVAGNLTELEPSPAVEIRYDADGEPIMDEAFFAALAAHEEQDEAGGGDGGDGEAEDDAPECVPPVYAFIEETFVIRVSLELADLEAPLNIEVYQSLLDAGYDDSIAKLASHRAPLPPTPFWDPETRTHVTPEPEDPMEGAKTFADNLLALVESPPDFVVRNTDSGWRVSHLVSQATGCLAEWIKVSSPRGTFLAPEFLLFDEGVVAGTVLSAVVDPGDIGGRYRIYVKTLTGKTIHLAADERMLISEVKGMIHGKEGIPVDQQRIIFNGRQMEDMIQLKEAGVTNGQMLHLVLRLRGT